MNDAETGPIPPQPIGEVRVNPSTAREVWLWPANQPLRCGPKRDGRVYHRFSDHLSWSDGCLRCDHRGADGLPDCNRLVYFVGGNFRIAGTDTPTFVVAIVSHAEMRYMREQRMTAQQAIEYLGIGLLP